MIRIGLVLVPLGLAAPALAQQAPQPAPEGAPPSAQAGQTPHDPFHASIVGSSGQPIGRVTLRGGESATVVRIEIQPGGLSPGWHGLHFHMVGDCSDAGQFQAAGGPINQEHSEHGLLSREGPDEGDLPNIFAAADGSANAEVSTFLIGLRARDQEPGLLDADGSALVIYAREDDHMSQPAGNAGDRVACAVIR